MGKIKLTESQIQMLQSFENKLPKKKVVRLTAEQYNRIFEAENPHDFDMGPKPLRPSTKVSNNFKKGGRDIPDSNIKFEGAVNEAGPVDIMDFGQHIIRFLKRLLTDPSDARINKFWRDLGVSKEELTDRMFELGMIGHGIINGKKILKIMKNDFLENIKTLYTEYVPQNEGIVQMGDDIEIEENGDDVVKKALTEPFQKKQGQARSPEMLKAKIAQKRKEELKRREDEKNRPLGEDGSERIDQYLNRVGGAGMLPKHKYSTGDKVLVDMGDGTKEKLTINKPKYFKAPKGKFHLTYSMIEYGDNMIFTEDMVLKVLSKISDASGLEEDNYPAGAQHDPRAPWNQVDPDNARRASERPFDLLMWHQETAIFEKDGKYYTFNVEGTDHDEYAEYADREEIFNGYDEDGMPDVDYGDYELDEDVIDNYVNDNYKHLSFGRGFDDYENGVDMVEIDQEMIDDMLATAKYIKNPKEQESFISVLKNLTVSEVTTAASSGAFVGKMGGMPIQKGISPADALREDDIEEASKKKKRAQAEKMKQQAQADANKPVKKKGGLQTTQFTDQEIWDAMRGNVQKDRKKEKAKYAGRKDKHKGKISEITEDHDEIDDKLMALKYRNFQHPSLGVFYLGKIHDKHEDDNKLTYSIGLKKEDGESDSELFYSYDKKTGKDELVFSHGSEIIRNAYDMFDELYALVFDGIKEALRPNDDIQESGGGVQNSGQYATPGFASSEFFGNKGKKGKAPVNKGITHKKTMYPKGKMVKVTESQMALIKKLIVESNNQTDTAYPEGGFVELDDCTKLNNNKEAQNGGCSVGAVDNVVKTKQTKNSVVSDDAVYSEVARKTGRTIAEVKKLIQNRKG